MDFDAKVKGQFFSSVWNILWKHISTLYLVLSWLINSVHLWPSATTSASLTFPFPLPFAGSRSSDVLPLEVLNFWKTLFFVQIYLIFRCPRKRILAGTSMIQSTSLGCACLICTLRQQHLLQMENKAKGEKWAVRGLYYFSVSPSVIAQSCRKGPWMSVAAAVKGSAPLHTGWPLVSMPVACTTVKQVFLEIQHSFCNPPSS